MNFGVSVSGVPVQAEAPPSSCPSSGQPGVPKLPGDVAGAGGAGGACPPAPLPCLNSNICIREGGSINRLTGGHRRTAYALTLNIQQLVESHGIERLGFFTLTFADAVLDMREAQRRFHSLESNVLRKRYRQAIGVWERQRSGRLHCHLVLVLSDDIRTGSDFAAFERGDYRSANPALRAEWHFWGSKEGDERFQGTARRYGFGRTEMLPVRSTAEGIARYVGKYVAKHVGERDQADKGARLVRYMGFSDGSRRATCRFSWAGLKNGNGWLWRRKLEAYCKRVGVGSMEGLKKLFGPRWAFYLQSTILAEPLSQDLVYPSWKCAFESRRLEDPALILRVNARLKRIEDNDAGLFNRTYLLGPGRVMGSDPVWAVPSWDESFQGVPERAMVPSDWESACNAMRLYASRVRLTPWRFPGLVSRA